MDLLAFDYSVFRIFNSVAGISDGLDFLFIALAEYGIFVMAGGLILFAFLEEKKKRQARMVTLQAFAAAALGRGILVSIIRMFFFRTRPFVITAVNQLVLHSPSEGSFPSGHATMMFAMAFSLFFVNTRWGLGYLIIAIISSLARIVTGVHFPLDIVGGMLLGALSALLTKQVFDYFITKHPTRGVS